MNLSTLESPTGNKSPKLFKQASLNTGGYLEECQKTLKEIETSYIHIRDSLLKTDFSKVKSKDEDSLYKSSDIAKILIETAKDSLLQKVEEISSKYRDESYSAPIESTLNNQLNKYFLQFNNDKDRVEKLITQKSNLNAEIMSQKKFCNLI